LLLNLFGGAAVLLAGARIGLWWVKRYDSLGRKRPFPSISTVLLIAAGVACFIPGILRAQLEGELERAAGVIVGSPVEVRCQSFGQAFVDAHADLGWVAYGPDGTPERATLIKRNQCRDLADYLRSDKTSPSLAQVIAVHILTHEAMHMKGHKNEAETECLAMQNDAATAEALGAPVDAALSLAVSYWENVYPRMPSGYRTDRCGPGEQLDLGEPGAPWS
jgi:hypothetical protein